MSLRELPYPDPGLPDTRSGLRFLVWLGRRQLRGQLLATCWGTLFLASLAGVAPAVGFGVQAVIDRDGGRLTLAGLGVLVLGGLSGLTDTLLHRAAVANWIGAAARVQQLLARQAAELGGVLTRRVAAGEVVAVSTGDVERIGWFVEVMSRFLASVAACLAVAVAMVVYQPVLGIAVAAAVPVLGLAVLPLMPPAQRRADDQRAKAGRATELAADTVAGLRVLRGIGGEELFLVRYRRASQEVRAAAVRNARMWALITGVQVLLPGLFLIAVVWFGVHLALDGRITVGELVTCYGLITYLINPLRTLEETAAAWTFSRASADRAAKVLSLHRAGHSGEDADAAAPAHTVPPHGDLSDALSGLVARAGELTAVVCGDPDAAGALADRLGGHSPTACGEPSVRLGGTALDLLPLDLARATILVQDKDPVLLSGTLRELLQVPSSGRVSAEEALRAAQCDDVLDTLALASPRPSPGSSPGTGSRFEPGPLLARITERGRSLSGGQRQRLALARSLVADPPVLVLDEPTSAVDSHTEARIAAALRGIRAGRTTVVFTSSPLVLDQADRVVLIQNGRVAATGSHRRLIRDDPRYRAVVTRDEAGGITPVEGRRGPSDR